MNTARKPGPTHKRTEGRALVWGSEFAAYAAALQGGSAEIEPSICVCGPWPSCYPRPRLIHKELDRGVQAVVRGSARCSLHILGRSAKAGACGRCFAVLSTQVSTVGLRLRHSRLACGGMLEVSREAVAAGEERLVSCAAEQSKYCFIYTITLGPCGDLSFTSSGSWRCLRGGADVGLDSYYAACI
jgi:hypothetical protein